jgi:hypothetical protein
VVGVELQRYLVELERPAGGFAEVRAAAASARRAADEMRREGVPVRFLRSLFVPEDGACFLLFEAPSPTAARQAAERAHADVTRVTEARRVDVEPDPRELRRAQAPAAHGSVGSEGG